MLGGEGVEAFSHDHQPAVGVAHRRLLAGRRDDDIVARTVHRADQAEQRERDRGEAKGPGPPDRHAEDGEREEGQREGREGAHMHGRARRRGDEARRPQNELDAQAHIEPDRRVKSERIERRADERARHREELDDRQGQRIAERLTAALMNRVTMRLSASD